MQPLEAIELGTLFWFQGHRYPVLDEVMIGITFLGEGWVLTVVTALGALGFLRARQPRVALLLILFALAGGGLSEGTKWLIGRPRPDVARPLVRRPSNSSFPSGHAL